MVGLFAPSWKALPLPPDPADSLDPVLLPVPGPGLPSFVLEPLDWTALAQMNCSSTSTTSCLHAMANQGHNGILHIANCHVTFFESTSTDPCWPALLSAGQSVSFRYLVLFCSPVSISSSAGKPNKLQRLSLLLDNNPRFVISFSSKWHPLDSNTQCIFFPFSFIQNDAPNPLETGNSGECYTIYLAN